MKLPRLLVVTNTKLRPFDPAENLLHSFVLKGSTRTLHFFLNWSIINYFSIKLSHNEHHKSKETASAADALRKACVLWQLPKAKEQQQQIIFIGKEKPREKLMFQHDEARNSPWSSHRGHVRITASGLQWEGRSESLDCAVKQHTFSVRGICIGVVRRRFLKALHGSLGNRHTGKYANGGCPKDNATDTPSMVTVIQRFAWHADKLREHWLSYRLQWLEGTTSRLTPRHIFHSWRVDKGLLT